MWVRDKEKERQRDRERERVKLIILSTINIDDASTACIRVVSRTQKDNSTQPKQYFKLVYQYIYIYIYI